MSDEILCAFSVRIRDLGWAALATATLLHACASAPRTHRETDLNAAVRRVQTHEAAIAHAECTDDVCQHAQQICEEAQRLVDADLQSRCHQANHACEGRRLGNEEPGCD